MIVVGAPMRMMFRIKAEDRDRQGILENAALLQHLVRRAIGGGGKGGAAGFLFEHLGSKFSTKLGNGDSWQLEVPLVSRKHAQAVVDTLEA